MKITFTLQKEGNDRLAFLTTSELPAAVVPALVRSMSKMGQMTIAKAKVENFTGKGPFPVSENKLGVRSGDLLRTLGHTEPIVTSSGTVSISMGSPMKYFGIHEFGFNGTVSVAAASVGNYVHPNIFGRGELGILAHTRKAHSRKMNMPARRPLGTAIEKYSLPYLERFLKEELDKEFKN